MTTLLLDTQPGHTLEGWTSDRLEQRLVELETLVTETRLLVEVDGRQLPLADGCRSLDEWICGRLDISAETASQLRQLTRTTVVVDTGVSFDKLVALGRLAEAAGPTFAQTVAHTHDVAGIRRLTARHHLTTTKSETDSFDARFFVIQPNLDYSTWKAWGTLPGLDGAIIEKALFERADQFPTHPNGQRDPLGQRMADALTSVCQDTLTNTTDSNNPGGPLLVIFADHHATTTTDGVTGIWTETGPSLGPNALEQLEPPRV